MMSGWFTKTAIYSEPRVIHTHAICPLNPLNFFLSNGGVNLFIHLEKIISNLLFHFNLLIQDVSLNMPLINLKLYKLIDSNQIEGTMSQNFYLGPGYNFM